MKLAWVLIVMALGGCDNSTVVDDGQFHITLKPDAPPEFKRQYVAPLRGLAGGTITITMYTSSYLGRTDQYGELRQGDGKYILFHVHDIARDIIDRGLVNEVQKLTEHALALDAQFVKSEPDEFVDSKGTRWRKAQP